MNFFEILAHGEDFEPDLYLRDASFEFDRVWHRGDPRGCQESKYLTSGIAKVLGDGLALAIGEQDRIASDFLEEHENALAQLSTYPGVDTFILGLHYRIESYPNLRGFCMSASAQLMDLALRTGVELTFYVELKPSEESDECCGT